MKRLAFAALFMLVFVIGAQGLAFGDDPEARKIMEKVDARATGDNQTADMEMILIDKKGRQRVRKITSFSKDKGEDKMQLMFFLSPADVKDTAFLTYDYDAPQKEDDQWLYLPALKKTKRIASADKSGSFMGSDLNYSDMSTRELEDFDYRFYEKGREQEFDGIKTWVIWSHPRSKKVIKETGYEKALIFVRQDNYFIIRSILWTESGGYLKYMMVNKLNKIDGIWVAEEMQVSKKKGKRTVHQTILNLDNIKFNQNLDQEMFSVRRMEKGY